MPHTQDTYCRLIVTNNQTALQVTENGSADNSICTASSTVSSGIVHCPPSTSQQGANGPATVRTSKPEKKLQSSNSKDETLAGKERQQNKDEKNSNSTKTSAKKRDAAGSKSEKTHGDKGSKSDKNIKAIGAKVKEASSTGAKLKKRDESTGVKAKKMEDGAGDKLRNEKSVPGGKSSEKKGAAGSRVEKTNEIADSKSEKRGAAGGESVPVMNAPSNPTSQEASLSSTASRTVANVGADTIANNSAVGTSTTFEASPSSAPIDALWTACRDIPEEEDGWGIPRNGGEAGDPVSGLNDLGDESDEGGVAPFRGNPRYPDLLKLDSTIEKLQEELKQTTKAWLETEAKKRGEEVVGRRGRGGEEGSSKDPCRPPRSHERADCLQASRL